MNKSREEAYNSTHHDETGGLKTFESGLGSEDLIDVITAPLFVRPIGMAGGLRRFGGAGGGRR